MRVNSGADIQSRAMGGDSVLGYNGTTTSGPTATTATDTGASWTTNAWAGHAVCMGNNTYGVILSNTGTVLTIDMWHTPATPESAASTPASGTYLILPGQAPAWWMGLSTNATAPAAGHVVLDNGSGAVSELWASGGGLNRKRATFAHTTGASSYTLTGAFTANSNDGASNQIQKIGVFCAQVTAAPTTTTSGPMEFETAVPSPPTLVSGDSVTITETVSI